MSREIKQVQVGDQAPDFRLESQHRSDVTLAQFRGQQAVVLYFYPKDETPGCVREACAFRDAYESFVDAGAVVIGVSSDSARSHEGFAQNHNLPFLLVSDSTNELRQIYGVPKTLGLIPGRVTYVIDKEGVVRHIFSSQMATSRHVAEALETVRKLAH